jgi:hypothetical protein
MAAAANSKIHLKKNMKSCVRHLNVKDMRT